VLFIGLDLRGANVAGCLVVLVLAIISFDSLGLVGAALVLLLRRGVSLAPVIATMAALFSGVYFPLEALPPAVQRAALLLPSTHALYGIRLALLRGAGWSELWPPIAALVWFDVLLVPLALVALRFALRLALREGTLGQY
jgi:ABC-2 type transport system permease protein